MNVKKMKSQKRTDSLFAYLFLAPDAIGLLVFTFIPVFIALFVSLHEWDSLSPMKYVGFQNYAKLFSDSNWWESLLRTIKYTAIFLPTVFFGSLGLAVFINSFSNRVQQILRTLYFVPFAISTVVAGIIWRFLLDEKRGFLNKLIGFFGIAPQSYLTDANLALFWIAIISAWLLVGYYMIVFLAAIKDIPKPYYEAAEIDGASKFRQFWTITFPLLTEVKTFVLVVTTIASFQVFDQVRLLTNGGPVTATTVSVFYIYKQAFESMKLGYASALAFVLFIIIFIISRIQLKLQKNNLE